MTEEALSPGVQAHPVPIFICGTSRSGTSLLQAALERHGSVSIAGETHYFDDLRSKLGKSASRRIACERDRQVVEDYFLALSHRPYGHGGVAGEGWMSACNLRARAIENGDTPDAYFRAFCEEWCAHYGRTIWGEKTPRHAFRLSEILQMFPAAKVVYMLRDPRAVVASYRDWKYQGGFDLERDPGHAASLRTEAVRTSRSYHPVTISLLWRAGLAAAIRAQQEFGVDRVRIQRYESVCSDAEAELNSIFHWIGLEPPPNPSAVPVRNSSYEAYRRDAQVVRDGVARWKTVLKPEEIRVVELCIGRRSLVSAGYEPANPNASPTGTARLLLLSAPAIIRATVANANRSGNVLKYILTRVRLALSR